MQIADTKPFVDDLQRQERCQLPKILFINGFEPGNQHVGAILAQQILEVLPPEKRFVVSVVPRGPVVPSEFVGRRLERRYEHAFRPIGGMAGRIVEFLAHKLLFRTHIRQLAKQCNLEFHKQSCEAVVVVLESPTLMCLADAISRTLNAPLLCFVMDGPELQCRHFGYSNATTKSVLKRFERALKSAKRLAVAGESMKKKFEARYKTPCTVLRQGLPYIKQTQLRPKNSDRVLIGFAGTVSAPDAFEALLTDLNSRGWKLANRPVTLRLTGARFVVNSTGPISIEHLGWRSVPETIELMSQCDVVYLPQPFAESQRECAELSFPNKLCTYLPARTPIALHTPEHGSLADFFAIYNCGPVSHNLQATQLLDKVEVMLESHVLQNHYLEAVEEAFSSELNSESLHRNVYEFLNTAAERNMTR